MYVYRAHVKELLEQKNGDNDHQVQGMPPPAANVAVLVVAAAAAVVVVTAAAAAAAAAANKTMNKEEGDLNV